MEMNAWGGRRHGSEDDESEEDAEEDSEEDEIESSEESSGSSESGEGSVEDDEKGSNETEEYKEPEVALFGYCGEETLQQLRSNDPLIEGLSIRDDGCDEYNRDSIRKYGSIGKAIGANTRLKKLEVIVNGVSFRSRDPLWKGIARNRSIEHVRFEVCDFDDFGVFTPFFKQNNNLRCVQLMWCEIDLNSSSVISALSHCKNLTRLDISPRRYSRGTNEKLIESLNEHHNLLELHISAEELMGVEYLALAKLMKNPATKIYQLGMSTSLNEKESIKEFCHALVDESSSVRHLSLGVPAKSKVGWHELSTVLSNPNCKLEKLDISGSYCTTEGAVVLLLKGLVSNKSLKSMILDAQDFTKAELWADLSVSLRTHDSLLEELSLGDCKINDEGMAAIFGTLAGNKVMKKLNLKRISSMSPLGWSDSFSLLKNAGCNFRDVDLSSNNIDDVGAEVLTEVLVSMTSLDRLDLRYCRSVSPAGWQSLLSVLQQPGCNLRKLIIGSMDDDTTVAFANAFANNTSLEEFGVDEEDITARRWNSLCRSLCDITSIMSTFSSNHTLRKICIWDEDGEAYDIVMPEDLISLLEMNKDDDKAAVAREKIILHHFSDQSANNLELFYDMKMACVPYAIGWIGRNDLGFHLMYNFVRGRPSLFERYDNSKVRRIKRKQCM